MDQAKWAIPRQKKALVAKSLSGFQKPRFKVEGVWVHNALLALWIVDSRVPSDSSMVIETLSRSIQLVATECERRGKDFPQQLCVWVLRTEDDRIFSISFIVFDVTSNQFTCSQCCRTCPGGQLRSGGKECHGDQIFIHAADTDSFEPDLVAIQQTRSHTQCPWTLGITMGNLLTLNGRGYMMLS